MAVFKFAAAAAWAGIIPPSLCESCSQLGLLGGQDFHHLVGVASTPQQFCHHPHRPVDVLEKCHVTGAEIVQAGLAVRSQDEAVLGTLTVAGKPNLAFAAVAGQCIAFVSPEFPLRLGGH
jgi:hypothetical protein